MSEAQVTALNVLTSPRILFKSSPREISVEGPKLTCCARGQWSIDLWQVGCCWEPKANQINSTWPRLGSKVLFVYVCSRVGVNKWSHTLRAVTHYKPLTNGPLAVLYLFVSFQSSQTFVLWIKGYDHFVLSQRLYPPPALFTLYESRKQTNWCIKTA